MSASTLDGTTPPDFGLPSKFSSWRTPQMEAVDLFLDTKTRYIVCSQPTGTGKTLIAPALQVLTGEKVVVVTATKPLQDQYMGDFGLSSPIDPNPTPMVDIRGQNNYKCKSAAAKGKPWYTCEVGRDECCEHIGTLSCTYEHEAFIAANSRLVVTNYQFWLNSWRSGKSEIFKDTGILVLDEGHEAVEELARFLSITLTWDELDAAGLDADGLRNAIIDIHARPDNLGGKFTGQLAKLWSEWADSAAAHVNAECSTYRRRNALMGTAQDEHSRKLTKLADKLGKVSKLDDGWVWQSDKPGKGIQFDCIFPGKYANQLFQNVRRIVVISATIKPYTMSLLGLSGYEYKFREWPRVFPLNRMPFYFAPTATSVTKDGKPITLKLTHRTTQTEMARLVETMDKIIDARLDRKGIIHSVSYARAQQIILMSRHKHRFVTNFRGGEDAAKAVKQFRAAQPGGMASILISPSFSTGHDFKGKQCEWQIIVKVPFADTQSAVAQERKKDDRWGMYSTMQELVQAYGRGMRADWDQCETFILDGQIKWFMSMAKKFAPYWLEIRHLQPGVIPKPPAKLP